MKAILEFNLDDFDEKLNHLRVIKSTEMALAIFEIVYNTKKSIINIVESEDLDPYQAVSLVFEKIRKILEDHHIDIDEIVF